MIPLVSVILCTYNPRKEYLQRALSALERQSLDYDLWEMILIDNASDFPVEEIANLSWHQRGRIVREDELGLTSARLRGIKEAESDLILFVDDDNILDQNYLKNAIEISRKWPFLGIWGGRVIPEFETQPPEWTKHYWGNLAIRDFSKDQWGNSPHLMENLPCGAGLCLRRDVAEQYVDTVLHSRHQKLLGRKGSSLASAEDTVIVLTACEMGYGIGLFTDLELIHLMPSNRLEENYLIRLEEGLHYSGYILSYIQGNLQKVTWKRKILNSLKLLSASPRERRFRKAAARGAKTAKQMLNTMS